MKRAIDPDVIAALHGVPFPSHGAVLAAGRTIIVLPVLRLIWEQVSLHEADGRYQLLSTLPGHEFELVQDFQPTLSRVLLLMDRISEAEGLLAGHETVDPDDPLFPRRFEAHEYLHIWMEAFFSYARLLADRLAVVLRYTASEHPASFPQQYRKLLTDARQGSTEGWHLRDGLQELAGVIASHSQWFELLAGPSDGRIKGIRDTFAHRHVRLGRRSVAFGDVLRLRVELLSPSADAPVLDLMEAIATFWNGFCAFLTRLPHGLWLTAQFTVRDVAWERSPWPAVQRFVPHLRPAELASHHGG